MQEECKSTEGMGTYSGRNFLNLGSWKCHFLFFPGNVFIKLPITRVISIRYINVCRKKDIIKFSDAIKEVTSKGKDFFRSNGQTIKHQRPYASHVCAELQESSISHQSPHYNVFCSQLIE